MEIGMLPGCCGANVFFGFNNINPEELRIRDKIGWCSPVLAKLMVQAGITEEAFRRPIVTFVHSSTQNDRPFSPKSFAEWLKRRKEEVVEMPTHHDRHGTELVAYFWHPSNEARRRLRREITKIGGTDVRPE